MDLKQLQAKLGMTEDIKVLRKSQELQRLCKIHFNSSEFGVGEVCKAVLCVELACQSLHVPFDHQKAVRCSGLSDKAYMRSFQAMQNALGLRKMVDVRELAIQFGCVRLIDTVYRNLALYQQRFVAALPASRRASAYFNRPIFASVAFYLSAKKNKLKVDKSKLLSLCASHDAEFNHVMSSMLDLCFDVLSTRKVKRQPNSEKANGESFPTKRSRDEMSDSESESLDEEDTVEVPGLKRSKRVLERESYNQWKDAVISAREAVRNAISKPPDNARHGTSGKNNSKQKQTQLKFEVIQPSVTS